MTEPKQPPTLVEQIVWATTYANHLECGVFNATEAASSAVYLLRLVEKRHHSNVYERENLPPEGPDHNYAPSREAYRQNIVVLSADALSMLQDMTQRPSQVEVPDVQLLLDDAEALRKNLDEADNTIDELRRDLADARDRIRHLEMSTP